MLSRSVVFAVLLVALAAVALLLIGRMTVSVACRVTGAAQGQEVCK